MKLNKSKQIIWAIGASDSSGGAGIQSDINTLANFNNIHTCSILSAITAQNSYSIKNIESVSKHIFNNQISTLLQDIPPNAIKISVLTSTDQVDILANLFNSSLTNKPMIIYDPVLSSSSKCSFISPELVPYVVNKLFKHLSLLTPNVPEAELITQTNISSRNDMILAAKKIIDLGVKNVLIKGGHLPITKPISNGKNDSLMVYDLFMDNNYRYFWCLSPYLAYTRHIRGTGCKLASLIVANYLQPTTHDLKDAVILAKSYFNHIIQKIYTPSSNSSSCIYTHQKPLNFKLNTILSPKNFPKIIPDFAEKLLLKGTLINSNQQLNLSSNNQIVNPNRQIGLYPIVPDAKWVETLAKYGVKTIQLRVKPLNNLESPKSKIEFEIELESQIKKSIEIADKYNINLYINDYYERAIAYGAKGVHLGQEDLQLVNIETLKQSNISLGISSHSFYELGIALLLQPTYIALGPIYPTTTKKMPFAAQGISKIKIWERLAPNTPIVAIGGINLNNLNKFTQNSVYNIAMISAITNSDNPEATTTEFLKILK